MNLRSNVISGANGPSVEDCLRRKMKHLLRLETIAQTMGVEPTTSADYQLLKQQVDRLVLLKFQVDELKHKSKGNNV